VTFGAHDEWRAAMTAAAPWCTHVRIGVDASMSDVWRETCGIDPDGALLVRPDQHIAWKSSGKLDGAMGSLATVLSQVMKG
jgi:2,4-dichlorophenol 6-monooxygenase